MSLLSTVEPAAISFFVLGSIAFMAHLISILKSYLKIREMRAKAKDKQKKTEAPLYVSRKKLVVARRHVVNRPKSN